VPKQKMLEARELIQQKRYDEARAILKTVDHPTAQEWLVKLDTVAPRKVPLWIPLLSLVTVVVIIILSVSVVRLQQQLNSISAQVNFHESDIRSMASDLSIVAAPAENADRYAHSHDFSDASLKSGVSEIDNALERILTLRGVSFTWDGSAYPELNLESGHDYGVLAQEVAQIFPELVSTDPDTGLLLVNYQGLISILIEAVREQQLQIDELRASIGE